MRTPITPMMKSAAVNASDSASTGCPPSSEDHGPGYRNQKQHARQLERQQIIPEQWLRDHAHRVQLLELLLVEVACNDQLRWKFCLGDDNDLAQQANSDERRRQLPPGATSISQLRWVPKIQQHDDEQEHHHDRAGVDEDLHH